MCSGVCVVCRCARGCGCACVSVQECILPLHANIHVYIVLLPHTRSILTTYVAHVRGCLSTPPCSVLTALTSASSELPSSPSPLLQPPVSRQKSLVAHNYVLTIPFLQYNCDSLSVFSLNTTTIYVHTHLQYTLF